MRNEVLLNGKPTGIKAEVAAGFFLRLMGWMFKRQPETDVLQILKCNSIHSFFMFFKFDAVFLDKDNKVVEIIKNIMPFKVIWPVKHAESVMEFISGKVETFSIKAGDELRISQ